MEQVKTAAIYCRTAVRDDTAIERQKTELTRLATEQGYEQPFIFIDNGISGLKYSRPAFDELNAAIGNTSINAVFIRDLSRIGRNFVQTAQWIEQVQSRGITLISACEGKLRGGLTYGT
jgi:DNA invertase Pin-like site-specific DNA recombinase